ncbi:MAG: host attachment protein [Herminiimonas sp.]|nr:host attachment protein [Herminiimonas sp.]
MQTTWILVADSTRARIFETQNTEHDLREIEDIANPQGRAGTHDLETDSLGRFYGKGERQQAHTAPPHVSPVEHEIELFTKSLADYLDKARTEHRYDKLCLIAPPKFLGRMHQKLSKEAQKLVEEEIAKDISWFGAKDVEAYLEGKKH